MAVLRRSITQQHLAQLARRTAEHVPGRGDAVRVQALQRRLPRGGACGHDHRVGRLAMIASIVRLVVQPISTPALRHCSRTSASRRQNPAGPARGWRSVFWPPSRSLFSSSTTRCPRTAATRCRFQPGGPPPNDDDLLSGRAGRDRGPIPFAADHRVFCTQVTPRPV